jgi:hypothetical protein
VVAPSISVSPAQISPNGDGDRDTSIATITLTEAAGLQVRVADLAGKLKGYIKYFGPKQAAGTYSYTFSNAIVAPDGSHITLGEGSYYVEALTRDDSGAVSAPARAQFWVNNTMQNASMGSLGAYPTLFSPNGDGDKDGMTAHFRLWRPADVTLRISTGGKEVRRLTVSYPTSGTQSLAWDGRILQNGSYVWGPAGTYYFRLQALPKDVAMAQRVGNAYADRTGVADKTPPGVSASVSRSSINTTAGESTTFSYSLTEPGFRQIFVINAFDDTTVNGTSYAETGASGSYTWSGRNSSGSYVAPGTYYIHLYVSDRAGNLATAYPVSRSVSVTNDLPASGRSARVPWSGYWWPMLYTYTTKLYNNPGPMTKYDSVTHASSYGWEYNNHRTTKSANNWWGHCQAWAAAAIMERQPYGKTVNGVSFSQDDVEGLYAETWTYHDGAQYGTKYRGQGTGSEAYKDVYPAEFDRVTRYWIGVQKTALIMDFTTGTAVWNYPVYAFSRYSTKSGDKEYVKMVLTRAGPYLNTSGTSPIQQTFYYTLQSGTNGWWYSPSGSSVDTHPDYIVKVSGRSDFYGNPEVVPAKLNELFR